MAIDVIKTPAYSFNQSEHRDAETRMWWGFFAQNAGREVRLSSTLKATYDTMVMYGDWLNVLATAITFRGIEMVVRPLGFNLGVPMNLCRVPDYQISDPDQFFAETLNDLGVSSLQPNQIPDQALHIIVDPHLMDTDSLLALAKSLKNQQVLVIMPENELVPKSLRTLVTTGQNEAFPSVAFAPFVHATLEEAMTSRQMDYFVVYGSGWRLLPAIIGVCDTVLQSVADLPKSVNNALRYDVIRQFVGFAPFGPAYEQWGVFPTDWYQGESTLRAALAAYLEVHNFDISDVFPDQQNKLDSRGEFTISPLWKQVS